MPTVLVVVIDAAEMQDDTIEASEISSADRMRPCRGRMHHLFLKLLGAGIAENPAGSRQDSPTDLLPAPRRTRDVRIDIRVIAATHRNFRGVDVQKAILRNIFFTAQCRLDYHPLRAASAAAVH
jgi:hypothetical protein